MKHDFKKDVRLVNNHPNASVYTDVIHVKKGSLLGLKLWSRIDYLVKVCKMKLHFSNNFVKNYYHEDDVDVSPVSKRDKRDVKINMAAMSKAAMRKVRK